jgi:putative nucleotidyltransferase with HDIG domain
MTLPPTAPKSRPESAEESVRFSEVVSALSYALDLTEGQPMGHSVRSCVIGMRCADLIGLPAAERSSLFYALLLKDLGCSSNAARLHQMFDADDRTIKRLYKTIDSNNLAETARYVFANVKPGRSAAARAWRTLVLGLQRHEQNQQVIATRCERGADIAARLGLDAATADAIRALDEHWDGNGLPRGLKGAQIPLLARICGLAQTMEVFAAGFGVSGAYDMLRRRRGTWFDPELVRAMETIEKDVVFWAGLVPAATLQLVSSLEPGDRVIRADARRLDDVAAAFAQVIDAKSPYTAQHSSGVSVIAGELAAAMGLTATEQRTLRRAGLLHDIGKLGVSNAILDKPAQLTPEEFAAMRKHPQHSLDILERVTVFREFATMAAAHHERLDGTGYHVGLRGKQLDRSARILAVADVTEALSAERPYRGALPREEVLAIMRKQVGTGLCAEAFEALEGLAWPSGGAWIASTIPQAGGVAKAGAGG